MKKKLCEKPAKDELWLSPLRIKLEVEPLNTPFINRDQSNTSLEKTGNFPETMSVQMKEISRLN